MAKKHTDNLRSHTPMEFEKALALQYLFYLEELPQNKEGKPDRAEFMTRMREDCHSDPELAAHIVAEYRQARDRGIYLQDKYRLVQDEVGGGVGAFYSATGVINKFKTPLEEVRALREKVKPGQER